MKIERINDWFARQGRWMVQKRWLVLSLFILVFAIGFTGLRYFKVSASWENYFLEDDPMLVKTKEFKDIFGNDNFAAVLTQCDNSFMKENLELIRELRYGVCLPGGISDCSRDQNVVDHTWRQPSSSFGCFNRNAQILRKKSGKRQKIKKKTEKRVKCLTGEKKNRILKNRTNIHRTTVSCKEEAERFWSRNVNWNRRNWIFQSPVPSVYLC